MSNSTSTPTPAATNSYEERKKKSYANLETKRRLAFKKYKYDSAQTRCTMSSRFEDVFKCAPYDWQLDAAEAFVLGMDVLLLAGTGSGKTIPFMLPLLLHPTKKLLIISPLKALQEDQTSRFRLIQITATPVNGDTWNPELKKNLQAGNYCALFAGPEMCLEHSDFRAYLRNSDFTKDLLGVIVDECHCISQWGGDFRMHYGQLDKLQGFFPPGTPFMAVSATLGRDALKEVRSKLQIDPDTSFYLNLGNDRHNIYTSVHHIKNILSFDSLLSHINTSEKTIIFCNSVKMTHQITQYLREALKDTLYPSKINFLHAYRSLKDKRKVMRRYRQSQVMILSATEAAGMGTDIPDIVCAIQWGVPSSLTVFKQRVGRAGRSPQIAARAILFAEESMFQRRRKKKRMRGGDCDLEGAEVPSVPGATEADGAAEDDDVRVAEDNNVLDDLSGGLDQTVDEEDMEWVKSVEPSMRGWIETEECERDYCDREYNNPTDRKSPLGLCCDRKKCPRRQTELSSPMVSPNPTRPTTPCNGSSPPSPDNTQSTPSKSRNENGKRRMLNRGPATRRGEHLQAARDALVRWRFAVMKRDFPRAPFVASVLLPDTVLTKLASNARLDSVQDIESLGVRWVYLARYGNEVLKILLDVDDNISASKAAAKRAKSNEKKRATAARKEKERASKSSQQNSAMRVPLAVISSNCAHPSLSTPNRSNPRLTFTTPMTPSFFYSPYHQPYYIPPTYSLPTQVHSLSSLSSSSASTLSPAGPGV